MQFEWDFCRRSVRVHFVGVWWVQSFYHPHCKLTLTRDTVSSLGLVKKVVHIMASTSTNACHFRHVLALDECRVKFVPEYFLEVNAHSSNM